MSTRVQWFLILALTASVCLGGTDASLVSGEATAYENRKEVQHVILTTEQLQALSRWLEQRRRKWGAHITEPSSEPASMSLELTGADGKVDHIGVIAAARGGHYMRLYIGPGIQWAYRSFGGLLKTRYAQQSINESDLATLRLLLFQPKTGCNRDESVLGQKPPPSHVGWISKHRTFKLPDVSVR